MTKRLGVMAAAAALTVFGVPAAAQQYSNSYTFLKAVKDRDGAKVTELVSSPSAHVLVNTEESGTGNGALHIVTTGRDLTWLSFLIGKGARVDQQNANGDAPLHLAAQLGWVEGADLLIRQKANVNITNRKGETPLIFAVQRRDLPMVRLLMSKGANATHTDNVAGYSALDYAKRDRRAANILKILEEPRAPAKEMAGPTL